MDAQAKLALRLLEGGNIFPKPRSVLSRITASDAVALPPGLAFSIATVVEHADFWQRYWMAAMIGERAPDIRQDWRVPGAEEWPEVRAAFVRRLDALVELASAEPFVHRMKSNDAAAERVAMIAEHNAYHLGQVVLIKRALKSGGRP